MFFQSSSPLAVSCLPSSPPDSFSRSCSHCRNTAPPLEEKVTFVLRSLLLLWQQFHTLTDNNRLSSPRPFDSPSTSFSGPNLQAFRTSRIPGSTRKMSQDLRKAVADGDINEKPIRRRKIVEHVALFKMKDSLTGAGEGDARQIVVLAIPDQGHPLYICWSSCSQDARRIHTRFPNKQALDEYMDSPYRWVPYWFVDFEAEVEDDIETIFRRGDDFQEGVEHFFLFRFKDNVSLDAVDKLLNTTTSLPAKFGELLQLTVGANFDSQTKGIYSHGLVARLPSEAVHAKYETFLQADPSWMEVMALSETSQTLVASYKVSPIGKTVM